MAKWIKDAAGNDVMVKIHEVPDNPTALAISAYGVKGNEIARCEVYWPEGHQAFLNLVDVSLNVSGDVVAITNRYTGTSTDGHLWSDNLTKKTSVELINLGQSSYYYDRIRFRGKNLVAVGGNLGIGANGTSPSLIRVVNEDTGEVEAEKILDFPTSGMFGVDSSGRLKLLLTGYELFGVLDTASLQYTELFPPRQQPSYYPSIKELEIGKVVSFVQEGKMLLLDPQALINGRISTVRVFPDSTSIIGDKHQRYAAIVNKDQIEIQNISSGSRLGSFPDAFANRTEILQTIESGDQRIALTRRTRRPDSFRPGTVLNYIDLNSGKVIRSLTVDSQSTGQMIEKVPGTVLTVETASFQNGITVVDLSTNRTLSQSDSFHLLSSPFRANSGDLVGINIKDEDRVCVADLLDLSLDTCLQDPLVSAAVQYGYAPFEIAPGKITLPLLKQSSQYNYNQLGLVKFEVQ
jgi:hypothetical protein